MISSQGQLISVTLTNVAHCAAWFHRHVSWQQVSGFHLRPSSPRSTVTHLCSPAGRSMWRSGSCALAYTELHSDTGLVDKDWVHPDSYCQYMVHHIHIGTSLRSPHSCHGDRENWHSHQCWSHSSDLRRNNQTANDPAAHSEIAPVNRTGWYLNQTLNKASSQRKTTKKDEKLTCDH